MEKRILRPRVLLRESYREDGKVKHRTIANLSKCSEQEIAAIKLALQHKHGWPRCPIALAAVMVFLLEETKGVQLASDN